MLTWKCGVLPRFKNMDGVMSGSAKVLAPRELRRLLAHVGRSDAGVRNTCIVLLSFRAGLRAAEVAGLDWAMVLGADSKVGETLAISAAKSTG